MINLISKSMRTKIIERGWKKERERRNWIDSISLSSPSMRLFSVDWRRWRCGHFLALWTAKKSWTPRSWTKRAGPGHARLSGTETGNLFGELHPVAFLVFPSVSPTYLCSPRVSNVSFSLLLLLLSHFRGGMEFGSGSIFFEIGIFSASFIFISLLSIIPSTWNSSNVFHEVHTVHKRGREFFLKAWTTIKLQRSWFLDISLDIYFLFGKK